MFKKSLLKEQIVVERNQNPGFPNLYDVLGSLLSLEDSRTIPNWPWTVGDYDTVVYNKKYLFGLLFLFLAAPKTLDFLNSETVEGVFLLCFMR